MNAAPPSRTSRARGWLGANPQVPQTAAAFALKTLGAGLSFGFSIVLARSFGAAAVGEYGLALTTLTLLSTVSLCGLDYVLIRTVAGDVRQGALGLAKGAMASVVRSVLAASVLMAILLSVAGVPLLARITGSVQDYAVLAVVSFGLVAMVAIRLVTATLRATDRVLLGQLIDGPLFTGLALVGVLALRLGSVREAAQLFFVAMAVSALVGAAISWRDISRWQVPMLRVPLLPMLPAGWKILLVALSGYATDWLILTLVARYHPTAEAGLFRTAWQIANMFALLVASFDAVAGPRIAAAARMRDHPGITRIWRQAIVVLTVLSLPLLVLVLVAPGWLLHFFGPEFAAAALPLQILALGQLINMLTGPIGSMLVMTGHERASLGYSLIALPVAAGLALWLIPPYGATGAAIAASTVLVFRKLVALWLVERLIGLRRSRL